MKRKTLVLIAGAAIVTLSFSFATSRNSRKHGVTKSPERAASYDAPVGGFASEDKF